jgi:hypothetical protein
MLIETGIDLTCYSRRQVGCPGLRKSAGSKMTWAQYSNLTAIMAVILFRQKTLSSAPFQEFRRRIRSRQFQRCSDSRYYSINFLSNERASFWKRTSRHLPRQRQTKSKVYLMDHDTQNSIPAQLEVEKAFPQRGSLCLYRLIKHTAFTCNRCDLEKTSKLLAFAKDKWDEPVCNGCYGLLLSTLEAEVGKGEVVKGEVVEGRKMILRDFGFSRDIGFPFRG